jgi:O-antigen/teichoic acid export membrane protein
MSFLRKATSTFATQIVIVSLGLLVAVLIARVLGPEGKGAYSLLILVPSILISLGHLGIGTGTAYYTGRRAYPASSMVSNALLSGAGLGVALLGASLAVYALLGPTFLEGIEPFYALAAASVVPLGLVSFYVRHFLLGDERITWYNLTSLLPSILQALLMVLLVGFPWRLGLTGALIAFVSGHAAGVVTSVVFARRLAPFRLSLDMTALRASLRFGVQGYAGNLIQFLNYRLDMILVSLFLGVAQVGYYSVAVNFAEALWYLPASAGMVLFSRTPRATMEQANRTTPIICRTILTLTAIAALLLAAIANLAVTLLFGRDFLPALMPLWILLPGVTALAINKVLCNELIGRGKPLIGTIAAAVSLAINVPLNLLLIPRLGIAGAALASTVSYSVCCLVPLIAFVRLTGVQYRDLLLMRREDVNRVVGIGRAAVHNAVQLERKQ